MLLLSYFIYEPCHECKVTGSKKLKYSEIMNYLFIYYSIDVTLMGIGSTCMLSYRRILLFMKPVMIVRSQTLMK